MQEDSSPKEYQARFWPKVAKSEGCWEWTASRRRNGYGQMNIGNRKVIHAHRIAWELAHGSIPAGQHVLHHCDNRGCVRPDHLFLGTHLDNMVDRTNKNRMPHGDKHSRAKLSTEQAVAIFQRVRAGERYLTIAADFKITTSNVSYIGSRKTWRVETEGL